MTLVVITQGDSGYVPPIMKKKYPVILTKTEREQLKSLIAAGTGTARKLAEALGVSVADLLERPPVPLAEAVITFPPGAVEEVLAAHRAGKLSKRAAQKAIADLARSGPGDPLDNAAELLLDYAESKRSLDREGAEA